MIITVRDLGKLKIIIRTLIMVAWCYKRAHKSAPTP